MDEKSIARISELSKKSRTCELSKEEKAEQKALREEYIMSIRQSLGATLEQVKIVEKDGKITRLKKRVKH